MNFKKSNATIYFPGKESLDGVTDMCIAAHQDDIEIMAYGPISECYKSDTRNFCGVVMTDGAGSPRAGEYSDYTNEQMKEVRIQEQNDAAKLGNYTAILQLGYASSEIKDGSNKDTVDELYELLCQVKPERLYTHNLADKHETHVAVVLRVIEAVRRMPEDIRPKEIVALEVWRNLDWLPDSEKVCVDTSKYPQLAEDLITVYRSQVVGGKSYDKAAIGRRCANATFFESHNTDEASSQSFGLDLMPLVKGEETPTEFIVSYIEKFRNEVESTIARLS
ncbi:MAG: PIG-L family deacetylase [Acutalibacteraceae bacterium]|nr:PIG-L family deacetylase [Acutalibacteraceae bacterium]